MAGCAGLVGIGDVPGGDGGVTQGKDGGIVPPVDGGILHRDGSISGFDHTSPGIDAPVPPPVDGGSPLTYQPSNIGAMQLSGQNTGPLTLTGDNCTVYTDYPGAPGIGCESGQNPPDDVFGVTLPNGGGQAVLYVFTYISIDSESSLSVQGPFPLIMVALGSVDIRGTIDVSADKYDPDANAIPGEHLTGMLPGFNNGGPQGGGGGSFCGLGGTGALGPGGTASMSAPGATYGNAALIPLLGGEPGGGAGSQSLDGLANGYGGGALQISAAMNINVEANAYINANGSGGVSQGDESGEGAGSGGAILLEAPTITIAGILEANGGEGSDNNMDGATPPTDAGVATEPSCVGGNGGAGTSVNGANGGPTGDGYGGGGGGVGWIRLNGNTITITGTVSPSLATSCASKGGLTAP
jgi:hypothetical protein